MKLEGRVAVVTAAGSGMGQASAKLFAAEGAHVVVVDLDAGAAQGTVDEITSAGGKAVARECDVANLEALEAVFVAVERDFGVLHVLYNHAGIPGPNAFDVTEDEYTRTMDVNVKSAFFGTKFALPLLRKAEGKGSIIYTSSTSGLVASARAPLYALAKGGIVLLMRSAAVLLGPERIRANAICPGAVETPMLPEFFGGLRGDSIEDKRQGFLETVPLGRPILPEEIARTALYLACDDSSATTGVALPVDGGYTAR
jgi:NAD(P)-dependent dehydrogenase (short-subunit alcohol dehydrogenase family)